MYEIGQKSSAPRVLRAFTLAPIITEESILLTIPVAFIIYIKLLFLFFYNIIFCKLRRFIQEYFYDGMPYKMCGRTLLQCLLVPLSV